MLGLSAVPLAAMADTVDVELEPTSGENALILTSLRFNLVQMRVVTIEPDPEIGGPPIITRRLTFTFTNESQQTETLQVNNISFTDDTENSERLLWAGTIGGNAASGVLQASSVPNSSDRTIGFAVSGGNMKFVALNDSQVAELESRMQIEIGPVATIFCGCWVPGGNAICPTQSDCDNAANNCSGGGTTQICKMLQGHEVDP